jgi:glc operon protein GlcG
MRRFTMMAAAFCVAVMASSGAFAQTPPASDNPNDAVPDAMPFNIPYGETINLETAKKVAEAAAAEATKRGWKMCIAVVGPSGDLIYFERMDDCQIASISISQHKARTAAKYRRATLAFEMGMARGPNFAYLATLDDVIASRGGNPLVVGGKLIGAIGVSGGTGSQDNVTSLAGVAALK